MIASSRPMKIMMNADTVGGVLTYATILAHELALDGHEVVLVAMGPQMSDAQRGALAARAGVKIVETDLELEWRDPAGRDKRRGRQTLQRLAREIAPDVVHLNSFREALADFGAPTILVAHSCVATWWRACRGGEPDARWISYIRDVHTALDVVDAWVAPTVAFRDAIAACYRPARPGVVVRNGIAVASPGANADSTIVVAGRMWDEAKGGATILAAEIPSGWRLAVLGPGASPSDEPALPRETVIERMRAAGVFVSAAVYEPFGLAALEAASSGCALVLSDIPTFRELWDGAALFFPPRDAAALSRLLAQVCGDDFLRAEFRALALDRARAYGASQLATRMCDLYRQAILRREQGCAAAETAA